MKQRDTQHRQVLGLQAESQERCQQLQALMENNLEDSNPVSCYYFIVFDMILEYIGVRSGILFFYG